MDDRRASRVASFTRTCVLLLLAAAFSLGCHDFAVWSLRTMPPWECVRAREAITLYAEIDRSGERARLANPVGVLEPEAEAEVLEHHEDAPGWETHYRVRALESDLTGWFAVDAASFVGNEIGCT